jgi:hypothetical protein
MLEGCAGEYKWGKARDVGFLKSCNAVLGTFTSLILIKGDKKKYSMKIARLWIRHIVQFMKWLINNLLIGSCSYEMRQLRLRNHW